MKLRAIIAALAAAPLALGLAACGNDAKPEATGYKPSAPTSTPVTTTTAAPQKAAPVAHLNRVTFVPAMNAAITKQKSWQVTGKMTAGGKTLLTISGVQTAKPAAMSMKMTGPAFNGRTAQIIAVGKTAYMSIPGMTPAGKYVKLTAADLADPQLGLGQAFNSADPTKTFKTIGGALKSVKYVRSQTIDGSKLDQYDLTLDTAKVLALAGQKTTPAGLPKTLTYSIWMDSDHLVRRMTFDQLGITMVMSMADYNKPVSISAPPASKVVSR
jgi:hypothetical protein